MCMFVWVFNQMCFSVTVYVRVYACMCVWYEYVLIHTSSVSFTLTGQPCTHARKYVYYVFFDRDSYSVDTYAHFPPRGSRMRAAQRPFARGRVQARFLRSSSSLLVVENRKRWINKFDASFSVFF